MNQTQKETLEEFVRFQSERLNKIQQKLIWQNILNILYLALFISILNVLRV